ncbi:hypothetical protein [Streptomyces sp. NPDC037389]|uniref:hypothetical protein n=1 Tax=Streptomyces sp. NPDC037389 TaxID=3155369 RepID=UPI0033EC2CEB
MSGFPFGETITVLRASTPGRDIYGNDLPSSEEHPVRGCVVAPVSPGGSEEVTGGRDTVTASLNVYLPAGADVRPTDRLRIRGQAFDVHGAPAAYRSPFTGRHVGVHLTARRATG